VRYRHDSGLAAKVRNRLRETVPADWPDFDDLASQLRLPEPTLRRKLRLEGLTYRDVKDEIRRGPAMESLLRGRRDVGDISADLGFSEPSAFHRAFRKWTGKSPGAFRRDQG
jgi:AraC-like DNA-binding protein